MKINFSQSRVDINNALVDALVERLKKDPPKDVIKHLIDMVLGHSFVDDELEVELQKTIAEVAGAEVIRKTTDDED